MEIAYECDAHTSACSLWRNKPAMEDISVSLPPSDSNVQVKKIIFLREKKYIHNAAYCLWTLPTLFVLSLNIVSIQMLW